jgi:hypothetical protein
MRKMMIALTALGAVAIATPASAQWHHGWHNGWRHHHGWWGGPRVGFYFGVPHAYAYRCPLRRIVVRHRHGRVVERFVRAC